ncbi:hypothetical protein [Parabacteroides distasonis]|uniref:hypothetical protein n=2 Tax=Bacteroidia TaxID=200643 RepID=UPI00232B17A7|nr:hypothetical protein [Parabacteroides distasonis]MDB8988121.1 hypothetical protein [Parabacteroides distasonis]MDB9033079.1 hypothetical protein [Parabacteroides distasonis]
MVRNVLKLDVMFELLLFLYLLPVMVIAVLLFKLVVWTIRKMFGLAVWLVRTLFALLWKGVLVAFTLIAVNRPPDRREEW